MNVRVPPGEPESKFGLTSSVIGSALAGPAMTNISKTKLIPSQNVLNTLLVLIIEWLTE